MQDIEIHSNKDLFQNNIKMIEAPRIKEISLQCNQPQVGKMVLKSNTFKNAYTKLFNNKDEVPKIEYHNILKYINFILETEMARELYEETGLKILIKRWKNDKLKVSSNDGNIKMDGSVLICDGRFKKFDGLSLDLVHKLNLNKKDREIFKKNVFTNRSKALFNSYDMVIVYRE